ncbi:hypothetical protein F4604DRAFT_1722216 [Suillus subluteus]|nr:hypothetical protein F4604DRAFT_1722216 [Suillus subluteus]
MKGRLSYCLLFCSSQVLVYFLISICSSVLACSSTPHASHILAPITLMVLLLLPLTCWTVRNEPRSFPIPIDPVISTSKPVSMSVCNRSQPTPQHNFLFLHSTLGDVLNTLFSIRFARQHLE